MFGFKCSINISDNLIVISTFTVHDVIRTHAAYKYLTIHRVVWGVTQNCHFLDTVLENSEVPFERNPPIRRSHHAWLSGFLLHPRRLTIPGWKLKVAWSRPMPVSSVSCRCLRVQSTGWSSLASCGAWFGVVSGGIASLSRCAGPASSRLLTAHSLVQ